MLDKWIITNTPYLKQQDVLYFSTILQKIEESKQERKPKQLLQSFFIVKEIVLGEESVDT